MTLDLSIGNPINSSAFSLEDIYESVEAALAAYDHVTPGAVLSTLRRVLYPLLSEAEQTHLREIRRASWWNLYWLFPAYAFMAGPNNLRLQSIASVIQRTVATHADMRAIEVLPLYQEVAAFRQMRNQAETPLPELCQFNDQGRSWLYRFCRYCWRRALPSGLLCTIHSPAKDAGHRAAYQEGRRMHTVFNEEILRIITCDTLEFHAQDMSLSVLHWPGSLRGWLRQYRPRVAGWLDMECIDDATASMDFETLQDLVDQIQGPTIASVRAQSETSTVNEIFCQHPELLWPVWVRAEAWLEVRHQRKANWGGARVQR